MKKALVILMALSMVFAAFADEPAVVNEIATFEGNATVTWGVNLDGQVTPNSKKADEKTYTGFSNSEEATLKFNLINVSDKSTTGEGVWGEIQVKIADDPVQYKNGAWNGKTVTVGKAKIHVNDMIAVGIRSGDNTYGEFKPETAVHNYSKDRKVDGAAAFTGDGIKGAKVGGTVTQGITLEVTLPDLLNLNVDFRSTPLTAAAAFAANGGATVDSLLKSLKGYTDATLKSNSTFDGTNWTAYQTYLQDKAYVEALIAYNTSKAATAGVFTDRYGIGTDLSVKAVENLSLDVGFGIDFWNWKRTNEDNPFGLYAAGSYKLAIDDTFYLKPQVAFTMQNAYNMTKAKMETTNTLIGAILFGWGDDSTGDPIKWVDGKVRNGFSVATSLTFGDKMKVPLCVGVWDSSFVEGLKVGAELCVNSLEDFFKMEKDYAAFDVSYNLGVITPKFSLKAQKWSFYVYGAVDYTGIANTTITLAYESGDLAASKAKAGIISLSAKVSF